MLRYLYYSLALFVATLLIMTGVEFIIKPDIGIDEIVLVCAYSAFNLGALILSIGHRSLHYYSAYIYVVYFLLAIGMSIITKFTFTRTLTIIQAIMLVLFMNGTPPTKNIKMTQGE